MSNERYEILTEDGQPTGKVMAAHSVHAGEFPHLCVQVWAMTARGKMLHALRTPTVFSSRGWDPVTIHAHVRADEHPLAAAMRGLEVDLGWRVARIELRPFTVNNQQYTFQNDKLSGDQAKLHRTVCINYSLLLPEMIQRDLDQTFKLSSGEICDLTLYPLEAFAEEAWSSDCAERYAVRSYQPILFRAAVEHLTQQKKEAF